MMKRDAPGDMFGQVEGRTDDPFYIALYVMKKHRVIYRILYVVLYVMKKHRVDYRMS